MKTKIYKFINKRTTAQIISLGFFSVILLGSLLLMLPIASNSGEVTPFIDTFFTATSAVCVTGQVIYNTAEHWSYFGRTVIIIMIEIGGLGFMTILILLFIFLGRKLNLKQRLIVHDALNLEDRNDAPTIVKYVLKFSFTVQTIGAVLLSTQFIPEFGLLKGIYFSIFHSISAFCNAGFDILGDSLISYTQNPVVILTIAFLIIVGGLGFVVWRDILTYKKNKRLLLHTRLTVIMSAGLLIGGTIFFFLTERNNGTFSDLTPFQQVINSFFMAVTPRTAGYANVDYAHVSMAGIFMTLVFMFIGAAPGSTGGGLKVTTFATLFLAMKNYLSKKATTFAHRTISPEVIRKSFIMFLLGVSLIFCATFILVITETIPEGFGIEYILMEVFSCFGTVGLSMGLTPYLTAIGKIVLILLMFAGRVGLLTFVYAFQNKQNFNEGIQYPMGNIMIG